MEHVETVIMRYDTHLGKYGGQPRFGGLRSTLCISSQICCKMGYKFCATGSMGFKNNLPSGEIVEQLMHASHLSQICNVVFMIAASPQTCFTNISKGCGDVWEREFFLGIPKIKYELLSKCYCCYGFMVLLLLLVSCCCCCNNTIVVAYLLLLRYKPLLVDLIQSL